MFALFGKKDSGLIGVDIGSSSVKLVALTNQSGQFTLDGYAVVPVPPAAVIDGNVQDVGQVADAVERAAKVAGTSLKKVVVAVPSSAVITKTLAISDSFSEIELEEQVKLEADQFIPYPLDEVAIDFEVKGASQHNTDFNDILVVACRRSDVELRDDAVTGAGLKCEVVDVDTYAVERAFAQLEAGAEPQESDELVGIVDIGAATLTLNVFRNGQIVYNREQAFGGNELTNSIHQHFGIPLGEVEQKLRQGELNAEIQQLFVLPFRGTIAQQVSRALQFFYSSGVHSELSRLYLMGGTAGISELAQQIEQEIGVTTLTADPFQQMKINSKISRERLSADASSLVKACGLAMRPIEG